MVTPLCPVLQLCIMVTPLYGNATVSRVTAVCYGNVTVSCVTAVYCNASWDSVLCWAAAFPNTTVFQHCPDIVGLDSNSELPSYPLLLVI